MAISSLTTQRISIVEFIFLLSGLMSCLALCIDAVLPALGFMARDFTVDASGIQLVVTSLFAGSALGQLLYGPVSDHWGRLPSIYAGAAGAGYR